MPPRSSRQKPSPKDTSGSAVAQGDEEAKLAEKQTIGEASEILRPLLRDPQQAPQLVQRVVSIVQSHSGPLPPPQMLGGYEEILPGAAATIFNMAVREQSHRHHKELAEIALPYVGMVCGFLVLICCIGGCIYLSMHGHENGGAALVAVPAVAGAGWLIRSRILPSASMRSAQQLVARGKRKR
jgi:uncharacterized membrane protein